MDVHVPYVITQGLRLRGVDVLTAQEDGAARLNDDELLDRSTSMGRVLFTQDKDFLREARTCQQSGQHFAGVIYSAQTEATIGQCVDDLELIAKIGDPQDLANILIYLPL